MIMSYSPGFLLFVRKRLLSFVPNLPIMDIAKLEKDLQEILDKKESLNKLDYHEDAYDQMEEAIHELEDNFQEKYGDYLEDALHEVHDEYCPDNDVLLPIAYIPNKFSKTEEGYTVPFSEGVYVDVDDYESSSTKLVILPGPLRIELLIAPDHYETVWQPRKKDED